MPKHTTFIEKKKLELETYGAQFDSAVSLITETVKKLETVNAGIDKTMTEIQDYQNELAATLSSLCATKAKNTRVIGKFNALVDVAEGE